MRLLWIHVNSELNQRLFFQRRCPRCSITVQSCRVSVVNQWDDSSTRGSHTFHPRQIVFSIKQWSDGNIKCSGLPRVAAQWAYVGMSVMWLLQTAEDEIIEQPHTRANTSTPADQSQTGWWSSHSDRWLTVRSITCSLFNRPHTHTLADCNSIWRGSFPWEPTGV